MPLFSLPALQMRLLALLAFSLLLPDYTIGRGLQVSTPTRQYIPGQYIIEYEPSAAGSIEDIYHRIVDRLSTDGLPPVDVEQLHQYDSDVLHGVAIRTVSKGGALGTRDAGTPVELSRADHERVYKTLRETDLIKAVHQDFVVHHARDMVKRRRSFPVEERSDPVRWQSRSQELNDPFSKRAPENTTGSGGGPVATIEDFGPHIQTGVKIQHDRGNYGEGVTVCVIDTGIDYSHPSFNADQPAGTACLGAGCRVTGGIDYYGADFDGVHRHEGPPRYLDLHTDPECYHGTHVAGIIGAQATQYTPFPFAGAAPKCSFQLYQAFPCSQVPYNSSTGGTTAEYSQVLSAFDDGYRNGCDIMHGSLAGGGGWDDFDSGYTTRYAEKGLLGILANSNAGGYGLWTGGSPAEGQDVIAVGATTNADQVTLPFIPDPPLPDGPKALGLWTQISWTTNGTTVPPLKVWFSPQGLANPGLGDDLCEPLEGDQPNLDGYVAFLFRNAVEGACEYPQQAANLAALNATAFVAINDGIHSPSYRAAEEGELFLGMVSLEEGLKVLDAYKKNKDITMTYSPNGTFDYTFSPNIVTENITSFSSRGPDYYGRVKPDVMAVGDGYFSTYPLPYFYGIIRGTSMSAPLVSGAAALYKAAKGKKATPREIQHRFVHSARPLQYDPRTAGSPLLSVFMQGGGQINVTASIDSQTALDPNIINILDTPRATLKQVITVSNEDQDLEASRNYTFTHIPAQSLYGLQPGGPIYREDTSQTMIPSTPPRADAQATVTFDPPTLTLVGSQSEKVTVTFTPPPDEPRLLMYSGYIQVNPPEKDPGGPVRVPYSGIAGSLASVPALVSGWLSGANTNLPAMYDNAVYSQIHDDNTSFPFSDADNTTAGYPILVYALNTGSERVTCDLVKADVEFTPTLAIIDDETCCQNALGGAGLGTPLGKEKVRSKAEVLPDPKRLYNDTPIVGNIEENTLVGRGVADETGVEFSLCTIDPSNKLYDPKTDDTDPTIPIPEGEYRFLLRAHRWNAGDPDNEYTYTSYLSHAFKYDKSSKGVPIPAPPAGSKPQGGSHPTSGPDLEARSLDGSSKRGIALREEIRRRREAGEALRLRSRSRR